MGEHKEQLQHFEKTRLKSQQQRNKITLDSHYRRWTKSDATTTMFIERLIGCMAIPVLGLWAVFLSFLGLGVSIALGVLGLSARLFRGGRIL